MSRYLHVLSGSAFTSYVGLELEPACATLLAQHRGMGVGQRRFRMTCENHPASEHVGSLLVEAIELSKNGGPFVAVSYEDEPIVQPLRLEYVLVPTCAYALHPRSQLVAARAAGHATWNAHFDLVLFVDDLEGRPDEGGALGELCELVDKRKLAVCSDPARWESLW